MTRRNVTVHDPADRPDVEVLVGEAWCPGEIRQQWQDEAGAWWANVQWRPPGTTTRQLDNFPADQIRPDRAKRAPVVRPE